MKTILVTGGAGFVGSNLTKRLLEEGNKVICMDNFYTGREENIADFIRNSYLNNNFEFVYHNINYPFLNEMMEPVDEIYNLACPASPVHYQKDPLFTLFTNTIGVKNVLDLAVKNNAKVLQASTSEVYGDPLEHPQKENYFGNTNTTGPRSCYDEGKRVAETIFMEYHKKFGIPIKIARIFNTYGPNMSPNDGRIISNFIMQGLQNKDLTVYGNGTKTRSLQYVDDLTEALVLLMNSDNSLVRPVNLGNPDEIEIRQLAEKVIKMTNSSSKIIYLPDLEDDPKKRRPDIIAANQALNWHPQISLDSGLKKTITYFSRINNTK